MLEIARDKADAANVTNITFERATIDEFSAVEQSMDAVLGLSILHLLANKEEVIAKVYRMLKPGGLFVSSTVCLGDSLLRFLAFIVPIGQRLGLLPLVKALTRKDLEHSLTDAGFEIDYQWQSDKGYAVFIVARKASL